jgi:competence protein ComGC
MVGTGSVKLGLAAGDSILAHVNFREAIQNNTYSNPNPQRVPSPDMTFISSKIEIGDLNSPLERLLQNQFEFSVLLILVLIIISILLIYIFINNKTKNKLLNITEINSNSTTSLSTPPSSEYENHKDNIQIKDNFINNNKFSLNNSILTKIILRNKKKFKDFFKKLIFINYELNKRFILGLLIFNCLVLIFLLLLNMYVSYELMIKIAEYVEEYIYLYKL